MKHGTVFEIPYTEGKAAYGRYSRLCLFQVFDLFQDSASNLSCDLEELKQSKILFTARVEFMKLPWKKVGVIKYEQEPSFRSYSIISRTNEEGEIYHDLHISEQRLINGKIDFDLRPASLRECIGLPPGITLSAEKIKKVVHYYCRKANEPEGDIQADSFFKPFSEEWNIVTDRPLPQRIVGEWARAYYAFGRKPPAASYNRINGYAIKLV